MQAGFEWSIFDALNTQKDMALAIDQVLKTWVAQGLNRNATKALFKFLYNTGYHNTLIAQAQYLVEHDIPVPAHYIFQIILENNITLSDEELMFFLNTADEEEKAQILNNLNFDRINNNLANIRKDFLEKEFLQRKKEKEKIIEKVALLKNENLIDEEHKIFQDLPAYLENDEDLLGLYEDFKTRHADNLFKLDRQYQTAWIQKRLLIEEEQETSDYEELMLSVAKENLHLKGLIAYSLCLADLFKAAKTCLEYSELSESEEWLYIFLLNKTNNHVLCLSRAQKMENKYGHEPEKMMACIYYQAISLHALGKTSRAIQLMDTVLKYDSNFKIAKELFDEWSRYEK